MEDMELDIEELSHRFFRQQVLETAVKSKRDSLVSPPAVAPDYQNYINATADQSTPATTAPSSSQAMGTSTQSTARRRRRSSSLLVMTNIRNTNNMLDDDRTDTCTPEPSQAAAPRCPRKRHSRLSSPHARQHRGQLSFSSTGSKRNYSRSRIYLKKNMSRNINDTTLVERVAHRIGGSKRKLHMSPFASSRNVDDDGGDENRRGGNNNTRDNDDNGQHRIKRVAIRRRKSLLGLSNATQQNTITTTSGGGDG